MVRPAPSTIADDKTRTAADRAAEAAAVTDEHASPPDVTASTRESVLAAAPIQAKLVVGAVDDPLEAEADHMADAAVARIAQAPADVARATEEEEPLQGSRTPNAAGPEGGAVDDDLEARLLGGGGAPLSDDVRGPMEQAFGADFSSVRVAENPAAAEIGARAYATGTDIRFAPGQYRPGTPDGQHLLAHELAHVVQQGGAAVHRDRAAAAGELYEGSTSTAGAAETVAGVVDDASAVANGDAVDLASHGAAGDLGVTGLAAGITGLVSGLMNFYERMKDGSTEDKLVAAHESLESAGGIAKGAIDVASAAGASIVGSVVPGLDLAYALLSAIRNVGQLVYLVQAKNLQGTQIDELVKAIDGQDAGKDADNDKLRHSLLNIQSHTKQRIASTAIKLGGDITMAIGAAAQLAAGPFGTAVKLAGALVKVSVSIGSALMQSYEAGKTNDARADFAAAAANGDDKRKKEATLNRLDNDAAFALTEIITRASYSLDPGADGAFDKRMLAILATYGIGADWLQGWVDGGRDATKREEAENRALRFIGAERDPKTIGQRIKATLQNVKNFFTGDAKDTATADPAVIRTDAMQQALSAHRLKPIVYATPAQVTQFFFGPVVEFLARKYNPAGDTKLVPAIAQAIDDGLAAALDGIVNWIVPGTLHVVNGNVSFEDAI